MIGWLTIALGINIINLIVSATAIQRNTDDNKAVIIFGASVVNGCIIIGLLIHYLMNVYPIISGR